MQITLAYVDIEKALKTYIKSMGISREVENISITAFRKGDAPYKAEITLSDLIVEKTVENKPTPRAAESASVTSEVPEAAPVESTEPDDIPVPAPKVDTPPVNLFGK